MHQDSTGHNGIIYPGPAQRMSAGTGILHSDRNDSWTLTGTPEHRDPAHFMQMWMIADPAGIARVTSSSTSTTNYGRAAGSPSRPACPSTAACVPSASINNTPTIRGTGPPRGDSPPPERSFRRGVR
ncbi:pirin family protein [Streptomyces sp. NPDC093984]|uniref:pirin family protein n=1 Tax=Streptomyces sp. NPDC093984 TaxID=3366052 RepID=UPI00382B93BE